MKPDENYRLLGVDRNVTQETLKRAFRSTILDAHPDQHPNNALATEQTRQVIEAYKAITEDIKNNRLARSSDSQTRVATVKPTTAPPLQWISGAFASLLLIAFVALAAIMLAQAIISDHPQRFHPFLDEVAYPMAPTRVAFVVDPDMCAGMEWYSEREYRQSLANSVSTYQIVTVYSEAARRYEAHKGSNQAGFYRSSLNDVQYSLISHD